MSEPIIYEWCPRTIRPKNVVVKIAINVESRPKIWHWLYLDSISLIIPNAGIIGIWASGWLRDQNKCWGEIKSPPLTGSRKEKEHELSTPRSNINGIEYYQLYPLIKRTGRKRPCPIDSIAWIKSALLIYSWVGCIGRLDNCSVNALDRAIERE